MTVIELSFFVILLLIRLEEKATSDALVEKRASPKTKKTAEGKGENGG